MVHVFSLRSWALGWGLQMVPAGSPYYPSGGPSLPSQSQKSASLQSDSDDDSSSSSPLVLRLASFFGEGFLDSLPHCLGVLDVLALPCLIWSQMRFFIWSQKDAWTSFGLFVVVSVWSFYGWLHCQLWSKSCVGAARGIIFLPRTRKRRASGKKRTKKDKKRRRGSPCPLAMAYHIEFIAQYWLIWFTRLKC